MTTCSKSIIIDHKHRADVLEKAEEFSVIVTWDSEFQALIAVELS